MTLLVDAHTYGRALRAAKIRGNLGYRDIENVLHISKRQFHRYCQGRELIPDDLLIKIFDAGLSFLSFRYRVCPFPHEVRTHQQKTTK